jgi:hypothetical protein
VNEGVEMLVLILLAVLAVVLFGLGFVVEWLFVLAVVAALLFLVSLFLNAAGDGRRRVLW